MSSDLEIHKDELVIQLTVTGELNADRGLAIIDKIALTVRLHPTYNILVDIQDTTYQPDMAEMLEVASECSKRLTNFRPKIAYLIPDRKERKQVAKLFKTCMELQGFEFRQFVGYDDALKWLTL
jgi:hypothetical protein